MCMSVQLCTFSLLTLLSIGGTHTMLIYHPILVARYMHTCIYFHLTPTGIDNILCTYNIVTCTTLYSFIHSPITHPLHVLNSHTHSLTHPPTPLLIHPFTPLLAHPLLYSPTHSLPYSPTHPFPYSLTHSLPYSLTHSLTHPPTHFLTHPPIHSSLMFLFSRRPIQTSCLLYHRRTDHTLKSMLVNTIICI